MSVFDIVTVGLFGVVGAVAGIIIWLWRSAPLDDWDQPDASMFEDGEGNDERT